VSAAVRADGRVLVSTHDLPRAGALREAFEEQGYAVELVTPDEDVSDFDDARLLVLTAPVEGGQAPPDRLVRAAHEQLGVPVFAFVARAPEGRSPAPVAGFDEVFRPDASADEVALVGHTLLERRRLQEITGIVGETDAMREVLERVVQIAPVNSTVLVTGESGTGKELVARGIHALSPRRHKPFIAVNVAALSETLLESELFGHEKGAFTGAIDARRGLFELAHGGTIFLDEIGEMPLQTQTKLLRVLEQREFLRVGGEKPIRVDVRIIAATNQDLKRLVAIGDFRKDLYYRLNVLRIELPPLRRRREDIPLLVNAFIREVSKRYDRPFHGISPEAMEILMRYSWPGNVRELQNLVESMVVLAPGRQIVPADIPPEVRGVVTDEAALPVPLGPGSVAERADAGDGAGALRPQLEFIFRTLVDLRMDVDDLRREFEAYRREGAPAGWGGAAGRGEVLAGPAAVETAGGAGTVELGRLDGVEDRESVPVAETVADEPSGAEAAGPDPETGEDGGEDGVVVYREGMTMEDLEREAIRAALLAERGNRRRAAQRLQIGERTLYRKLKKYGLDDEA